MKTTKQHNHKHTVTGTDIDEVKRLNAHSGLTYNQVKQLLQKQYNDKQ